MLPMLFDRRLESAVEISWATSGCRAALLLNDYPHAVIDFDERRTLLPDRIPAAIERLGARSLERRTHGRICDAIGLTARCS